MKDALLLAAGAVISLGLTEFTEVSPWLARRLVRWAAYRWSDDPQVASGYAEEWAALIDERPGKLLKLMTGVGLTSGAAYRSSARGIAKTASRVRRIRSTISGTAVRRIIASSNIAASITSLATLLIQVSAHTWLDWIIAGTGILMTLYLLIPVIAGVIWRSNSSTDR